MANKIQHVQYQESFLNVETFTILPVLKIDIDHSGTVTAVQYGEGEDGTQVANLGPVDPVMVEAFFERVYSCVRNATTTEDQEITTDDMARTVQITYSTVHEENVSALMGSVNPRQTVMDLVFDFLQECREG